MRINSQADHEAALGDQEQLVGLAVLVPDELAAELDRLDVVVVEPGKDLGLPVLAEPGELLLEIDDFHDSPPLPLSLRPGRPRAKP
jgi:hypothetical protein